MWRAQTWRAGVQLPRVRIARRIIRARIKRRRKWCLLRAIGNVRNSRTARRSTSRSRTRSRQISTRRQRVIVQRRYLRTCIVRNRVAMRFRVRIIGLFDSARCIRCRTVHLPVGTRRIKNRRWYSCFGVQRRRGRFRTQRIRPGRFPQCQHRVQTGYGREAQSRIRYDSHGSPCSLNSN
jgi:hypothetical protein